VKERPVERAAAARDQALRWNRARRKSHGQETACRRGCKIARGSVKASSVGSEIMYAKYPERYRRLLLAKRDELSKARDEDTALLRTLL
jgi:hypothetical protein